MIGEWWSVLNENIFLGNAVWRWLGLAAVILVSLLVGKIVSLLLLRQSERFTGRSRRWSLAQRLLRHAARPLPLLLFGLGLYAYVACKGLNLQVELAGGQTLDLTSFWRQATSTIIVIAVTWFAYGLVDILDIYLVHLTSRTETTLDDQLVPLLRKTFRVVLVVIAGVFLAQSVYQWDIGALVAGLGIGGLAFALAAKDMLANLFGSVTIFSDRPFVAGDRVKIGGYNGTIEEVGFRSTRLRTLDGHLVTVPNATVANEPVENISRRPNIKRSLNVTITYDTKSKKVQRAVEILREMLAARKEHFPEDFPPRVFFSDFNADSLNLAVFYWFASPDWWDYQAFNHEFNLELLRRFNEEAIEFAFPTQTLYVKQDSPIEATIKQLPTDE